MSPRKLPASVKGDVQRILDRAARRLLADQLERKPADANRSPRRHRKAA